MRIFGLKRESGTDQLLTVKKTTDEARPDVTAAVDELLTTLSTKFAQVSSEIFNKSKQAHCLLTTHASTNDTSG